MILRKFVASGVLAVAILTTAQASAQDDAAAPIELAAGDHRYTWVPGFGRIPEQEELGSTHGGVEVAADGRLYCTTDTDKALCVFGPDGSFERAFGAEFRGGVHGITIHSEGGKEFLYLAHIGRSEVAKLTLDGEVVWTVGVPEAPGLYANPQEYRPTDIAVAPDGSFYVVDGYGKGYVHQYDAERNYVRSWGGNGVEPGQMRVPHGILLDTRGKEPRLIVADRENGRLQIFDLQGELRGIVSGIFRRPCDVKQHPNGRDLVVADLAGRITLLDERNELIGHLGDQPLPELRATNLVPPQQWRDGEFLSPHGACFGADGALYVQDWNRHGRVSKLMPSPRGTAR